MLLCQDPNAQTLSYPAHPALTPGCPGSVTGTHDLGTFLKVEASRCFCHPMWGISTPRNPPVPFGPQLSVLYFNSPGKRPPSWHQPAGEGPAHRTGPTSPTTTGRGPGHPHFCPTSCRHRVPEPPPHRTRATWDFSAAHQGGQQPEGEQDLGDPHVQKLLSLWILGCNTLPTVGSPTQKPSPFCREVPLGRTEKPWPLGSSGGWG